MNGFITYVTVEKKNLNVNDWSFTRKNKYFIIVIIVRLCPPSYWTNVEYVYKQSWQLFNTNQLICRLISGFQYNYENPKLFI